MIFATGCGSAPAVTGGYSLDMQPQRPQMLGAYDFELLSTIKGHACFARSNPFVKTGPSTRYWFLGGGVERLSNDPLVTATVGAAVIDAIGKNDVDTMVVTHVEIDSKDDQTCADAWGRGVRLTKARRGPPSKRPPAADDDRDEHEDDDAKPAKKTDDE